MRRRESAGAYVLVAGPDGTGKSTLVRELAELGRRRYTGVRTMHWRPGLLPRLGGLAGKEAADSARPHDRPPYGPGVSLVRLTYYWLDQVVGFWVKVRPCRDAGGLVLIERGYWDMLVDPLRYRLGCPPWVLRALGALVPRPGLVVLLGGDPDVIAARKGELDADEVARQLASWRRFAPATRTIVLGDDLTEAEVLDQVARTLDGVDA
jgi:thymidylate kinase